MSTVTRRVSARSHRAVLATSTLADAIGLALRSQRRRPAPRRRAPAALMLAALAFAGGAQAQSAWTNPGLADWFNAGNWSAGVPNSSVLAEIDNGGVAEVFTPDAMANELRIGKNASGGLFIHSGGTVLDQYGYVGDAAGSLGQVVVDGAGSAWGNTESLYVGNHGAAEMLVSNGGAVLTYITFLGVNESAQAVVTVDGAGSSWTVNGTFVAGAAGSAQFTISNGGVLYSGQSTVGSLPGSQAAMVVDGAGSRWHSGNTSIGLAGSGSLTIRNGGLVTTNIGYISYSSGQGTVLVDGAGSRWDSGGGVQVSDGGQLTIQNGGTVATDADGASLVDGTAVVDGAGSTWTMGELPVGWQYSGTLIIRNGGGVFGTVGIVGALNNSQGAVSVDGAGSRWNNSDRLIVGRRDTGQLTISNGGVASNDVGVIGEAPGGSGAVLIDGAGSAWQNRELNIGFEGTGTLAIRNGAEATSDVGLIGARAGGHGEVVVDGTGSRWINTDFYVGGGGTGLLTIGNGGLVSSVQGTLGYGPNSRGTVLIDGAGSTWTNSGALAVGHDSLITIRNGGTLSSGQSVVVGTEPGSGGTVLVRGAGSLWNATSGPVFGYDSQLTIQDGGTVMSEGGYLDTGSAVLVDGEGSTWRSGGLSVGRDDGVATLDIRNGGDVFSDVSYVGFQGSSSGTVLIDGAGSAWQNRELNVGFEGTGTLDIRNGGEATSTVGLIGARAGGHGEVAVDGAGSRWTNTELYVGGAGTGLLTIGNGGLVSSVQGTLGYGPNSRGTVLIDGAGSTWTNSGDLTVGVSGIGALTIANGGTVGAGGAVTVAQDAGSIGSLNIGAAASDAAAAAGMLDAATLRFGNGAGTLVFNHTQNDYAFATTISGNGTLDVFAGTTVLTAANDNTGATNIRGGTLRVEGTLGDTTTTVLDGGTLGGSGSIAGDVVVQSGGSVAAGSSAGTLTVGSLTLNDGAILDYELGQAGVVGGGVNDLIQVNGDLTLDGRLDITDIGGFGAGVYRLIDYSGVLTDNTLDIGTLPTGFGSADLFVQTAIGGQVNLISSAGLTLRFWDGAVLAEHDNAAVDGGDGVWDGANRNWTQPDGALNGHWDDGQFAVFGGTGGDVEVVGEHAIAGMQFMSEYTLNAGAGAALRINSAETIIRVDPGVQAEIGLDITGSGGLVKTDTGTLVLSGDNQYAGGTTIRTGTVSISADGNLGAASGGIVFDGGALQNTADMSSNRDVTITGNGGTLQTDADLTLDGIVFGAGALTKDGRGTLTLSGDNRYTGSTRVLAGVLVGDADSIRGNLANDGSVIFEQANDDSFDGTIGGTGTMAKRGAGTLTLTNGSALDWTIEAGALIARGDLFSGDAAIAAAARLRFQQDAGGTYAGTISGDGRFEIASGGLFALTGDSAAFAGTTVVESGTLQMQGALGGSTLIASGATLSGTGTLGNVDNAGTVAAGNSIGTLTFTGDYVHRDAATLLAEIEPGGNGDLLNIAGTATIEGGQVQVVKLPGQYTGGTRYTLIDAAGGVSGSFSALEQDMPFLDVSLAYDASHVFLDVLRSDTSFASVCGSFNQCQVATTIDTLSSGAASPSADLITVIDELTTLDVDGALNGFDRLSGEAHGSLAGLLLEGHALYGQTVTRRIAARREAVGADRLHGGVWVRGYGASSELDGDGNAHGADVEQRGMAFGVDTWGGEHWLIGASVNAMSLEADFQPGDRGDADASNIALYASFIGERAYLDAVTSYAWWDNALTRRIEVGTLEREARSEYGGHRFASHLEAGWSFTLDGQQMLQPLVSIEYAKLDQTGFREDGAQDLDLIGRSQSVERTTVAAGLRWSSAFAHGDWTLEPTMQARWLRSFGDEHTEQEVAFAGAPQIGYRVRGVTWAQDRGSLGIGLQARRGERVDLFLDLNYQQGDGFRAHDFGAGLRYRW